MAVKVKICGITTVSDAVMAVTAGADALGLNFYSPSPRFISLDSATAIAREVGAFTTTVGLFVNASRDDVETVLKAVPINLLQFHGDETADYCESFGRPYIKAIRVKPGMDVQGEIAKFDSAKGLLLDKWSPEKYGGTGSLFDWSLIPDKARNAIILAGGLTPDNVAEAVSKIQPYAVDVSGGVESSPGKKSPALVKQFIDNAKSNR